MLTGELLIKNYKLKDIIKHKYIKHLNIIEVLSQFPNKGVNFKFRKLNWDDNKYFKIVRPVFKSQRQGVVNAVLYENNIKLDKKIYEISNYTSRGLWDFTIGSDDYNTITDNGLQYTYEDIKDFYLKFKQRGNKFTKNDRDIYTPKSEN